MQSDARLRLIYIYQVLKERTDEDHCFTTAQLSSILKQEYGIEAFRTTIKADIDALRSAGLSIQVNKSTQNLYNYIEREFDVPEIKLLLDAVMSSKFITKAKSDQLAEKLVELAGPYKAKELKRNLIVDGRIKQENEQIYHIIDVINDAINEKRKIIFQKAEYNVKKDRILHNNGETYVFSPYSLVWDGDFYYVVGYSDKYKSIGSHRVDKIYKRPEILSEAAVPQPVGFDINRYINTMFRMYDAPRQMVELQVENGLMDAIIDKFGTDVTTYACDQNSFRVEATVSTGTTFYNWIFGFQGKVRIRNPENVKEEYKNLVYNAYKQLL